MNKTVCTLLASLATALCVSAHAADAPAPADPATTLTPDQAKDLKTQSKGEYKARKKVAEANEELNKADCKSSLDGAAKRACEHSATAAARSDKADAKTLLKVEEQAIKDKTQK